MSKFLQNLNRNLLCAIDLETTGFIPGKHDIIQVCVLPADGELRPSKDYLPFICEIVPAHPENIDPDAMNINRMKLCDIMINGLEAGKAAELFVEWFEKLKLPFKKRIAPLGFNYQFDQRFMLEWLGPQTYEYIFHHEIRDAMIAGTFRNDCEGWRGRDFPFVQLSLTGMCRSLTIERDRDHDAVADCIATMEVYRRTIQTYVGG